MDTKLLGLALSPTFFFARYLWPSFPRWLSAGGFVAPPIAFACLVADIDPFNTAFIAVDMVALTIFYVAIWDSAPQPKPIPHPPNTEISLQAMAKMLHCSEIEIFGEPDLSNGLMCVFRIFNGTTDPVVIDRMRGVIWAGPDDGSKVNSLPEPAWTNRPLANPGDLVPVVVQQLIPSELAQDFAARLAAGLGFRFILTRMDFYATSTSDRNHTARLQLWQSADIKLSGGKLAAVKAQGENIPPNSWNVEV